MGLVVRLCEVFAGFVVGRPKLVIVLWVLALLLSTPLSFALEKCVSYSESKWLPSDAESIRASRILEGFGGGGDSTVFLAIVSSRPFTLESAMAVEEDVERLIGGCGVEALVLGPAGVAELVAENTVFILEKSVEAVNGTVKGFYSVALTASQTYKSARIGATIAWKLVQSYLALLQNARKVYEGARNAAKMLIEYRSQLSKALTELDKIYSTTLTTMKMLHHIAWLHTLSCTSSKDSYKPPSPQKAVEKLVQLVREIDKTIPTNISGFRLGVTELTKMLKYIEKLGPCPSEKDYRNTAKNYIASIAEEKWGTTTAKLVKALLDLIDAFEGPSLEQSRIETIVEQVSSKLLAEALAKHSLPTPTLENIASFTANKWDTENLTATLIRAMIASQIKKLAGATAEKLVEVVLAGRDPVVELVIERQGLVEPTSASARQAIHKAMIELGVPDWIAKIALETSSEKELIDRVAEKTLEKLLRELRNRVDEESYPLLANIVRDIFENRGEINYTKIAVAAAKRVFNPVKPMVRILEEAYGVKVPALQILEQAALAIVSGEKIEPRKLLASVEESVKEQVFESLKNRMVSKDKTTILLIIEYKTENKTIVYNTTTFIEEKLRGKDYNCYALGGVYQSLEVRKSISEDIRRVDKLSAAIVLTVLLAVMGAVAASILPFLAIGASVLLGTAIVTLLAIHGASITSWARSMMIATALGLGIDYTAYVVTRVREELARGGDPRDAIRRGLAASIAGVAGSATTDFLGFASFLLAWDMPFLKSLGIALPPVVLTVALASVTLVPAILAFVAEKKWFWWPRGIRTRRTRTPLLAKLAVSKPALALSILALLAIPAAYNLATFTGSYDLKLFMPEDSRIVEGIAVLEEKLTPGKLYPINIIVVLKSRYGLEKVLKLSKNLIGNITAEVEAIVYGPTRPQGRPVEPRTVLEAGKAGLNLASQYIHNTSTTTIFTVRVELLVNPLTSEGLKLVAKIHDIAHKWAEKEAETVEEVLVGGVPATINELNTVMSREFLLRVLPAATLSMALSMYIVFRTLTAALLPLASVALGVSYALLAASILFEKLANVGLLWFLPTIVAVAALGVGMDYNSFYINRLLEEASRARPREAALAASTATTKLILGLSLIVSSSYSAMIFTRSWGLRELGSTLALAILFTSLIASAVLWPSTTTLIGDKTWWPRRMRRKSYIWELGRGVRVEESSFPEHL